MKRLLSMLVSATGVRILSAVVVLVEFISTLGQTHNYYLAYVAASNVAAVWALGFYSHKEAA